MTSRGFRTVGFFDKGYAIDEVDEFLRRAKAAYNGPLTPRFDENTVRNAAFHRQRRGYVPADVDEALDRLEAAFIQKRRSLVVADKGENAWLNTTYEDAKSLYPRLLRPPGQRFRRAEGWGYSKSDVDALIDRLSEYFDGKIEMTARDVRDAVFGPAKDYAAYDEAVVDVYLERATSVLLSVE
ncbi:MAG: DivIVA domain-containing protein [Actinomycetaceae bacterium]|nr:DivIVA domain-containing protein [Actinomycetaceae bacterium]